MHSKPIILYGIKNCDSVKKARAWLDSRQISYRFHDYRIDGLEPSLLRHFIDQLSVSAVLNQRSTSWRQLSDAQKADLSPEKALRLMLETPTLVKRPIISFDEQLIVGFNPDQYSAVL
ncbi:MAG: ArsC family reductase [Gammaproteobacteria bacterium]